MQTTQKENKKKQTQLSSPGSTPGVLNPKVISPHEREILLKQIESLQYKVREQKTTNAKVSEELRLAHVWCDVLVEQVKTKDSFIKTLQSVIKSKRRIYKDLVKAYSCLSKDLVKVSQLNQYLLLSKECKPEIQKAIQALKLPVHLN